MSSPTLNPAWVVGFRRGLALVLALSFIALWADYDLLYGSQALVDHELLKHFYSPPYVALPIPLNSPAIQVGYLVFCAFVFSGYYVRVSSVFLLVLHGLIFLDHPYFSYGFDYLASSLLLYSAVLPTYAQPTHTRPYLRCLQLHTCIIYFFAGACKAAGPTWYNGEALWKALQQPGFVNPFREWLDGLGTLPALWVVAGWMVLVAELGYPLFIWWRQTRRLWLFGAIGMHIGIAVLLGLYAFSALMVVINLAAFHLPYRPFVLRTKQNSIPPMVGPFCAHLPGSEPLIGRSVTDTKKANNA